MTHVEVFHFVLKNPHMFPQGIVEKHMEDIFGEIKHERIPGESLELMDHFPDLPEEFAWAKPNNIIAKVWLACSICFTAQN